MKPALYLETSVIGYLTSRFSRDLVTAGRQQLTRDWWRLERDRYDLFLSPFVLDESEAGDAEAASERAEALSGLPLIEPDERADALAQRLMRDVPPPPKAAVDAAHIAVAAVGGMDYLLTWNFKHIANAVLRDRIERACRSEGYKPSVICTPDELLRREP
ncbi:type II toxin-antitoxin system VapC family toxin [Rubrivirga sp.]|uniref:type II toxin-antitoxin system VapC family toxin n=1 Tax=Rubrivirga sp. TaxID=1885344 RepID=UPI003B517EEA